MKLVFRPSILILMVILLINNTTLNCYAHPTAQEHDKELMNVLFGNTKTYRESEKTKACIKALKNASYLAIDQYGGNGEDKYKELNQFNSHGIPGNFSDIDYMYVIPRNGNLKVSPNTHRRFTHQGWKREYGIAEANKFWNTRRKVLLGTINNIFKFNKFPIVISYDEKCESMAGIVYYVHLLGDYDEAEGYKNLIFLTPLAGSSDGVDIINNVREYAEILFVNQGSNDSYKKLLEGLDKIEKKAKQIQRSNGGVNTDLEFKEYKKCAQELLALLIENIPSLLKNEDFFSEVFYPDVTM